MLGLSASHEQVIAALRGPDPCRRQWKPSDGNSHQCGKGCSSICRRRQGTRHSRCKPVEKVVEKPVETVEKPAEKQQ